ncbi:MAG: FAD:protein FMN transferase [Lachnospirales bacterium]
MKYIKKITALLLISTISLASCTNSDTSISNDTSTEENSTVDTPSDTTLTEEIFEESQKIHTDTRTYDILSDTAQKYEGQIFALDTIITLIVYTEEANGEDLIKLAQESISDYENILSKTIEGSFTYELNKNKTYDLSGNPYKEDILYLLGKSMYYNDISDGYFDITIEPLVRLWGFGEENQGYIPTEEEIKPILEKIDSDFIEINGDIVSLKNDATVDFGAIAKGYIADKTKDILIENGCSSAIINLGGNVLTIGSKPNDLVWKVGIQDPNSNTGNLVGDVSVKNKSVVTSGIYERNFVVDDVLYHHILDYKTGFPSASDIASATIICDYSIDGDALATTVVLLGSEKGLELINSLDNVELLIITKDNEYKYSNNFNEKYEFNKY